MILISFNLNGREFIENPNMNLSLNKKWYRQIFTLKKIYVINLPLDCSTTKIKFGFNHKLDDSCDVNVSNG